jgi:hypothetical protein
VSQQTATPSAAAMRAAERTIVTDPADYDGMQEFVDAIAAIIDAEIKPLVEQVSSLRKVCAEAYQLAGLFADRIDNAKEALDNLSAAANGEPIPHETFLPVSIIDAQIAPLVEAMRNIPCSCVYGVPNPHKIPAWNLLSECLRCAALRRAEGGGE